MYSNAEASFSTNSEEQSSAEACFSHSASSSLGVGICPCSCFSYAKSFFTFSGSPFGASDASLVRAELMTPAIMSWSGRPIILLLLSGSDLGRARGRLSSLRWTCRRERLRLRVRRNVLLRTHRHLGARALDLRQSIVRLRQQPCAL